MKKGILLAMLVIIPSISNAASWTRGHWREGCPTSCSYFGLRAVASGVSSVLGNMYVCRIYGLSRKAGYQTQSHPNYGPGTCTVGHAGDEVVSTDIDVPGTGGYNHECLCE